MLVELERVEAYRDRAIQGLIAGLAIAGVLVAFGVPGDARSVSRPEATDAVPGALVVDWWDAVERIVTSATQPQDDVAATTAFSAGDPRDRGATGGARPGAADPSTSAPASSRDTITDPRLQRGADASHGSSSAGNGESAPDGGPTTTGRGGEPTGGATVGPIETAVADPAPTANVDADAGVSVGGGGAGAGASVDATADAGGVTVGAGVKDTVPSVGAVEAGAQVGTGQTGVSVGGVGL